MSTVVKKCAACRTEKPVSEMKTCMHGQMHYYVCDSKCMRDFYNPPKEPSCAELAGMSKPTDAQLTEMRRNGLSIDGENEYKRDLLDAIVGAMAFGFQNTNPPPEGYWGKQFWDIGRAEAEARDRLTAENERLSQVINKAWNMSHALDEGEYIQGALDAWRRPVKQNLPYDFSGNPGAPATEYCNGWNDAGGYWKNWVEDIRAELEALKQQAEQEPVAVHQARYLHEDATADEERWQDSSLDRVEYLKRKNIENAGNPKAPRWEFRTLYAAPPSTAGLVEALEACRSTLLQVNDDCFKYHPSSRGCKCSCCTSSKIDKALAAHRAKGGA